MTGRPGNHLRVLRTLARTTVLETLRRKDLYVVVILSGLLMLAGSIFQVLGVRDLEVILKDVSLLVVSAMSTILCVTLSFRQLPEEIQRRTLFPLLARPISRWHLIVGKWAGATMMSIVALVVLTLIAYLNLVLLRIPVGAILWQYLLLKALSMLVISAMTVALSLYLTPSATLTVSLLLVIGASTFSNTLLLLPDTLPAVVTALLRGTYFLLPHVDLFDLRDKVTYDWPPIAGWVVGFLMLYAAAYTALFLGIAIRRFQRQML